MKIEFWKMHGASNDFVLVDDRTGKFPAKATDWISDICSRRTGVGCEGVILVQKSAKADFKMRFFNPDGSEVEMCGNGARCVARLAHDIGVTGKNMEIETVAGIIKASVSGSRVKLVMTAPVDWRIGRSLRAGKAVVKYGFVNSGVPHAVVEVRDLSKCDVKGLGCEIRYHRDFSPAGTNANFISVTGRQSLRIRTYERGVEDETLACGTGMVAAALVAGRAGRVVPPVKVTCASGDTLVVDYTLTSDGARDVTLLGPAVHVFRGTLMYPPADLV